MTSMADLDLDELERLIAAASPGPWRIEPLLRDYLAGAVDGENRNVADMRRADAWLVVALANAAPALIAAARAAQHRGETLGRVAEAVGYPRDAHYGDVLGRIDELVAELDRLRALCREAATAATAVPITASYSCRGCGALGSRECEIGCWVPRLGQMIRRLNEAGGEP